MKTAIYVVQPQDTQASIAFKFGISIDALQRLNGWSRLEPLVAGQAILVPGVPKTIQSLGYFQLSDLSGLEQTLSEAGTFFTYGNVFQFPITAGGAFPIPADAPVEQMVHLLKTHRIAPLLVITNLTPTKFDPDLARTVLHSAAIKSQVLHNLLFLLKYYGFSGVNIDFEGVYPEDRELFSDFIKDVRQTLEPEGYQTTLTVPPKNTDDPDNKTHGAYDYHALGQWADLVFIMTYDWGYMGGPPQAVAPITEVEKVISYATSQIPPSKISQGIPLYGYDWSLPYTPDTSARVVNLVDVYDLARRFQATVNYDCVTQSPNLPYTDEKGQDHIVWFEDSRSLQTKYTLARDYNLGSVGFWSGQNHPYGFPQNWEIFEQFFTVLPAPIPAAPTGSALPSNEF